MKAEWDGNVQANLALFLQTEELDDAQQLAEGAAPRKESDRHTVTQILECWDDPQAVANLLMHPELIPAEARGAALLRGLHEPLTYATLAAVVGLQDQLEIWSDTERAGIAKRLQAIIFEARPVIADRASVTLLAYAGVADVNELIFLLGYPGETVQHNALLALVRLLGVDNARDRIEAALAIKRVTDAGRDFVAAHLNEQLLDDLPLLSHIPNRSDFYG